MRLEVAGLLPAGAPPTIEVRSGSAVRIMTGAAMPPGADAVVMVEETETTDDGSVLVRLEVKPGDSVREVGSDVPKGARVFEPQTIVRPAHLGVFASLGFVRVPVYPRARVGVISTGDELVEGGGPLAPGQIRESNREMLLALVEQANCTPVDLGLARDDKDEISEVFLRGAAECDAVISSGGVSMGDFDLVKVVLDEIGEMRWMQIAIKPAKPFAFGVIGERRTPVFGLPGNPVSSLVSFELFARPALRQMMGHAEIDRPAVVAVDRRRPAAPSGRQDALRAGHRALRRRRALPRRAGRGAGFAPARRDGGSRRARRAARRIRCDERRRCARHVAHLAAPHSLNRWPTSSIPTGAPFATCGSRSRTAATSAARTACPPRGCSGCPAASC